MKLDDAILVKLADEDDLPDFVCPSCGGAFFSHNPLAGPDAYECDTVTDSWRCKWKGLGAECFLPSRSSLAQEIIKLRGALGKALPHVSMATSVTSGREFREATEALLAEMRALLGRQA